MFKVGKSGLFTAALAAILVLAVVACGNGETVIREVEVTRVVEEEKEVEVTRVVKEETEVEVTRVVEEEKEVEVTRVVEVEVPWRPLTR